MCGVAGVIRLDGGNIDHSLLKSMTDAIAHRGPDGEGQWIEGNVGIGHRRLSIIDLSETGHQPMLDATNRFVLSYNGEVYNFKELRSELEKLGYRFRGKSDSEVVLNAFVEWGTAAFIKFNGMFALSIWDKRDRVLTLARDRYGIKPIYYAEQSGLFSFGSEQKAILANPNFLRNLNKGALLEYFTFQNIFTDQTFLRDIHLLKPGHFLELRFDEAGVAHRTENQYWDYWFREPDGKADRQEYVEELERLFTQAVERQLVSDVEIGAFLSGGIDSGSVVTFASKKVPNLKTFTVGFDLGSATEEELNFDERIRSEAMSSLLKTEHYEMVLKSGDMERSLPALAWALEDPRVGQSYPNFYAAKLAGKFVKVVLSGVGGDELFAGYPWRYYKVSAAGDFETYIDDYYLYWQRLADNSELRRLLEPIWSDIEGIWTRDIFRDVFTSHPVRPDSTEGFVNHSLYFEAKTFLHGLFVVEDKLSMAHGLETRVPFMDNDLVDFAMACPVRFKINNLSNVNRVDENLEKKKEVFIANNGVDGKALVRQMLSSQLEGTSTSVRKQGFSSPDASWFRNESRSFIERVVKNASIHLAQFMRLDFLTTLLNQHFSGEKNKRLFLWSILNFAEWIRLFLNYPTSDTGQEET